MSNENKLIGSYMGVKFDINNEVLYIENPTADYDVFLNRTLRNQTSRRCNQFDFDNYYQFDKSFDWILPVYKKMSDAGLPVGQLVLDTKQLYTQVVNVLTK